MLKKYPKMVLKYKKLVQGKIKLYFGPVVV